MLRNWQQIIYYNGSLLLKIVYITSLISIFKDNINVQKFTQLFSLFCDFQCHFDFGPLFVCWFSSLIFAEKTYGNSSPLSSK